MTIAICGSLSFHRDMRRIQRALETLGHKTIVPKSLRLIESEGFQKPRTVSERLAAEAKYDFIREHFGQLNQRRDPCGKSKASQIAGYIGGNTFLKWGSHFILVRPFIFSIPYPMDYELELAAMHPVVLSGDLTRI